MIQKPALKKYNKSDNNNHSFYKYHNTKKFENLSLEIKYYFLASFFDDLDKFTKLKRQKEKTKEKKNKCV